MAMGSAHEWTLRWPRCVLLLQLTLRCVRSGQPRVRAKLLRLLEESRTQMQSAPPAVESLMAELWFATKLLAGGDVAGARHHAAEAAAKARRVEHLLRSAKCEEMRTRASFLRRQSQHLQAKAHQLMERSTELLARSRAIQRSNPDNPCLGRAPEPHPTGWRRGVRSR
jgi:hypothetical protein